MNTDGLEQKITIENDPAKIENHLHESEARWFAVYTNYKREKMVAAYLKSKNVDHYLPLLSVVRQYTRKIKKLDIPLINCYIFVKIVKSEYVKVLETEYVLSFVKFSKNLISIPNEEIEMMQKVLGEHLQVSAEQGSFNQGDDVEIIAGKLTGLKGKLISRQGKQSFLIALSNIGYSLNIEVDQNLLSKLSTNITCTE